MFALLSDGFFETRIGDQISVGFEYVEDVIRTCRNEPAQVIMECMDEAIVKWQGELSRQDDTTAIVIKRTADQEHDPTNSPDR